jgi:hypothetical protein
MADYKILNNVEHGSLRVITDRGAQYGDNLMYVMTFPFEMRKVQACYPILIHKDPETSKMYPVTLFGFESGENLFLDGTEWNAPYVPAMIQRHPFLIGFQKSNPASAPQRVVTIDVDHPRVSQSEGIALFQEHGGNSDYLESVADMLEAIHSGHEHNDNMMAELLKHDLVESVNLNITLDDGSSNQLQGFYMIDDEKLQQLSDQAILDIHNKGFLLPTYMMVASQSQMRRLVDLRNARLAH